MAAQSIPPLRLQKSTNGSSAPKPSVAQNRPLSELSPMAIRRNSPSFPKGTMLKSESSPITSSPFAFNNTPSTRHFWQGRDPNSPSSENRSPCDGGVQSPTKRSSIENLKKASRVKNSNMFAKEQTNHYDPTRPNILDGRPLSVQYHGNASIGRNPDGYSNNTTSPLRHQSPQLVSRPKALETSPSASNVVAPLSPVKTNASPTKSSLSKRTGLNMRHLGFDPETGIWEDEDDTEKQLPEGRYLHRHAKSVTFDQAPPQVNEYEMTTPVPSSIASGSREGSYDSVEEDGDLSFERCASMDHDDSFDASLEDTDKTPVVLPEDWRFMSPKTARNDLVRHHEDVFDDNDDYGSPAPTAQPGSTAYRSHQTSVNSVDSNGLARPLPPLPPMTASGPRPHSHQDSLSGALERMSNSQRALPSPPPAALVSKSDIRRMSGGSFSLEDRLRLMMLKDKDHQNSEADMQPKHDSRPAESEDVSPLLQTPEPRSEEVASDSQTQQPAESPRLCRESILRQLRDGGATNDEDDLVSRISSLQSSFDPDVPIPSLEDPTQTVYNGVEVKEEEVEDGDLYAVPDEYNDNSAHNSDTEEETASIYSQSSFQHIPASPLEEAHETPRAKSPAYGTKESLISSPPISLPTFMHFGDGNSFDLGLSAYMTPPSEQRRDVNPVQDRPSVAAPEKLPDLAALRETIQRPFTPEDQLEPPRLCFQGEKSSTEPSTPSSVIRHEFIESHTPEIEEPEAVVESSIESTIESAEEPANDSGSEATQDDENNRSESIDTTSGVEQDQDKVPEVRPFETRISSLVQLDFTRTVSGESLGLGLEKEFDRVVETQKVEFDLSLRRLYQTCDGPYISSIIPDSKDMMVPHPSTNIPMLPIPNVASVSPASAISHYNVPIHFETVQANRSPQRQRGYLMRQNTRIVIASERAVPEEAPLLALPAPEGETSVSVPEPNEVQTSPRKISQSTWTAEPWNTKSRRKSIRVNGEKSPTKRKPVEGPVPPLPGLPSNVNEGLGVVAEDELAEEDVEEHEDGAERGRLFVKVIGAKDLQLPLPQNERTQFALTLDNGLHCVTTAWLDLARSAPIGQEFELVVLNELEFQLTLQMKLEEPKIERPVSPTKPPPSPKKQGAFGRFFGSPKKKKESEVRAQLDAQTTNRPPTPPSAYELVRGLVAKDGSFARAYVALNEHEDHAYGRPYVVDIKCFNEWAMEEVPVGSSRSKKSVTQLQRRPPYEIGKLELQLLYVPKPKGAKDEDMPKSMNGAIRAIREAEEKVKQQAEVKEFEGYLSQQGGDCPYWRRRFFKLIGSKLTAYHETTLQPRATINLAKANKLIDDKSKLMQKETSARGGGRRKSGFADDEEGYMFVEEGFRIRFANGEVIDFYADSAATKEEWMKVLSQVVGKAVSNSSTQIKGWTQMVLKREKTMQSKAQAPTTIREMQQPRQQAPSSRGPVATYGSSGIPVARGTPPMPRPGSHQRTESYQPEGGSRSRAGSPVKPRTGLDERHRKTRSMYA